METSMWRISRATGSDWSPVSCSNLHRSRAARAALGVLALILGVAAGCGNAHAQSTGHGSFPAKGQHVFVPTTFIPDAFVDTELAIGIGYSNTIATDIPLFTPAGQPIGTVQGDLLFLSGNVEFNCALRDWIGFY